MKKTSRGVLGLRRCRILLVMLICLMPVSVVASGLLYKNYIIRYDRGWDILCEPYVVKEGDWVLKIFRQKGEIAHNDFREFTGLFERLNPHIRDIDMLRPGQMVDIPLKKLEHGTLPGQASGVVTIPFVTLGKVTEVVRQNSGVYEVQTGDTVSQLIARQYGRYGSKGYQEGVKLFQTANPDVANLDRIYAGQRLYLPDPKIREQSWYADLKDDTGNLRETPSAAAALAVDEAGGVARARMNEESSIAVEATPLEQAAAAVGGTLNTKGTYYLPRSGEQDFEIDLSLYPLLTITSEQKILFTTQEQVMGSDRRELAAAWPALKIAAIGDQASTQQIVAAIFEALEPTAKPAEEEGAEVGFVDGDVQITVRARWIKSDSQQRSLCITPIAGVEECTPESVRRYLDQHNIVLREILPDGSNNTVVGRPDDQRQAVKNILALVPTSQKDFVRQLARALGLSFAPDVPISFPYAGVQVQAYANLLSTGTAREVLIDFGDLYGDALEAIRASGPKVVQITPQDDYSTIARTLLTQLHLDVSEAPIFLAARRPAQYNTSVMISGLLYNKAPAERILLSRAYLHPALTDLLSSENVALVTW